MTNEFSDSCSDCGRSVGTGVGEDHFAVVLEPPNEDGFGWTLGLVCLTSQYGMPPCVDFYVDRLHEYWRRLDQRQPA